MAVQEIDTKALNSARSSKASTENELFLAKERQNRLMAERDRLKRHIDPKDPQQLGRLSSIESRIKREEARIQATHNRLKEIDGGVASAWREFLHFTDPRSNMQRLDERTPILLLPLRLETRFKEVTVGRTTRHQLWVRAYPDDCSIDTFEETLSESEARDTESFWIDFRTAAGNESKRRAAWRYLADGHGYGRAQHMINTYRPDNYEEIIQSNDDISDTTVILAINGKSQIANEEKEALTIFWQQYYPARSGGDSQAMDAAFGALANELGEERATILATEFAPANINQVPPALPDGSLPNIVVEFIEFDPEPDLQKQTWSRAPKVKVMPERLCLVAYKDDEQVVEQIGNTIPFPLIVGPDPKMSDEEMINVPGTDIRITRDMRWMVDFEEAISKGMGFIIDLTDEQAKSGFDRLFVTGIKMSATKSEGQSAFEELIRHHYSGNSGFSFLPVGTPTNNTGDTPSAFTDSEDADESYDHIFKTEEGDANGGADTDQLWWCKSDREWFCELLGISNDTFDDMINTDGRDQLEARAMNTALWPATWGYFFETMLQDALSDWQLDSLRWYFNHFVVGRGNIPSIRIDDQPYGILPTTAFSRISWIDEKQLIIPNDIANYIPPGFSRFLPGMNHIFSIIQHDWKRMARKVAHTKSDGDPHQIMLDILGLHGGSVEFHNRIGESFEHIYNLYLASRKKTRRTSSSPKATLKEVMEAISSSIGGRLLLNELGYTGDENPQILEKLFVLNAERLKGPLIDDQLLSELNSIRIYSNGADGTTPENYLQWLVRTAETSFDALRKEEGFIDNLRPNALLYLMLKYALEQSYFLASINLFRNYELLSPSLERMAKKEANFVHVREQNLAYASPGNLNAINATHPDNMDILNSPFKSESRYNLLYTTEAQITGSQNTLIHQYIPQAMRERHFATRYLYEQTQSLRLLSNTPTARLERIFTEHIDCASYRFDAWKYGLVNYQLKALRNQPEEVGVDHGTRTTNKGLYMGAYGWLENIQPEFKQFSEKRLDNELTQIFNPDGQYPVYEDSTNLGYINAPSQNHAVTGAILRNGYDAYANRDNANIFNVNLSSERVRKALKIVEGIQHGQNLAALLGYEFERGIHDNNHLANVDQYLFKLRRKFPLAGNKIRSTAENDENVSIEQLEARNVVDGLRMIEFAEENLGSNDEPLYFDSLGLGSVSTQLKNIIVNEINNIRDINDAVADLAFAESVHQVAQGNIERAAGTLDAYSSGNYPQIPDVIQTPRSGVNLTHRVAIHLKPNAPVTPGQTPRAMAEPAINLFLKELLPNPANIRAYVSFHHLASDSEITDHPVSMADLGLQPIDLLYMVNTDTEQAMTALDDRIVNYVLNSNFPVPGEAPQPPRPDVDIRIRYFKATGDDYISIFEIAPLMAHLRSLLLKSKPLQAGDVILSNEAGDDTQSIQQLHRERIDAVINYLESNTFSSLSNQTPVAYLNSFVTTLSNSLGEGGDDEATIISGIDDRIDAYRHLLEVLAATGLPQTGTGFLVQWRKTQLSLAFDKIAKLIEIWDERETEYHSVMATYDPVSEDAIKIVLKAERLISSETTLDPGDDPELFRTGTLAAKLLAFQQKRDTGFQVFLDTGFAKVSDAVAALEPLLLYEEFYLVESDAEELRQSCLLFAAELLNKAILLQNDLQKRIDKVKNELLAAYDTENAASTKVELLQQAGNILLGEEFKMIPSFTISPTHGNEWHNALAKTGDLLDYQTTTLHNPLPVDDWFYGVARVRDKMGNLEQAVTQIESFVNNDMELIPVQFPLTDPYCWFAAEFGHPDDETNKQLQKVFRENDHLLYTAYYHEPFDPANAVCGLLVDEWTEIVPTEEETAGLAFHYDRPNSEPPQTMLLAVSPQLYGKGWNWGDLLAILNETLDEAKLRGVEPQQIENDETSYTGFPALKATGYANLLPATISSVTKYPVSIMLNYAFNNLSIVANTIADHE